jgi:hypothetical protein
MVIDWDNKKEAVSFIIGYRAPILAPRPAGFHRHQLNSLASASALTTFLVTLATQNGPYIDTPPPSNCAQNARISFSSYCGVRTPRTTLAQMPRAYATPPSATSAISSIAGIARLAYFAAFAAHFDFVMPRFISRRFALASIIYSCYFLIFDDSH